MLQHYITAIQRYIYYMTNHNLKCLKKVYKTRLLLNYKLVIVFYYMCPSLDMFLK